MNNNLQLLGAITGTLLVQAVIWLLIGGLIFWLLNWLIDYCQVGEPFQKIAKVVVAIVAVLFVINALLTVAGRPFITF